MRDDDDDGPVSRPVKGRVVGVAAPPQGPPGPALELQWPSPSAGRVPGGGGTSGRRAFSEWHRLQLYRLCFTFMVVAAGNPSRDLKYFAVRRGGRSASVKV